MKKWIKYIWNGVTSILVSIAVVFALSIIGPKVTGLDMYVVLSGSMEPAYKTGSMIYVKEVDQVNVGDVVTFQLTNNTVATHRIIKEVKEDNRTAYITKGDANEFEDANLLYPNQIIGKAVFTIPYLGYFINYIQHPPGLYVAGALGVSLVLMMVLSDLLFEEDKDKKKVETDNHQLK